MSQENNQKYVLFFSEYCDYCKELLGEIKKFQLKNKYLNNYGILCLVILEI